MACGDANPSISKEKLRMKAQLKALNRQHLATFSTEELEKLELLDTIPSLPITTIKGKELVIGKKSDKPTVLLLFATWCPSCKAALPEIETLAKKYSTTANFVAIGREHSQEELETWLEKYPLSLDVVADPERELYSQFAGWAVPRLYVLDRTGEVAFQTYGWADYNVDMVELTLASF